MVGAGLAHCVCMFPLMRRRNRAFKGQSKRQSLGDIHSVALGIEQ